MKKNYLRNFIKGLSFTSVLFVFQACYGTPQDMENDILLEGRITSSLSHDPIPGIEVSSTHGQSTLTDSNGNFSMYIYVDHTFQIGFTDIDGVQNGNFQNIGRTMTYDSSYVYLEIEMDPVNR